MATTPSDKDPLEHICKELDELTLEYLTQMNKYTEGRIATNGALQKGFLDLAHAKYTMGAKSISHLSYDERMKAQVQLLVDHENKTPYTITKPPTKVTDDSTTTIATNKDSEGLRLRKDTKTKGQQKDADKVTEKDDKKPGKKEKKVIRVNENPLHWFGLLVSPSLRTSQGHFQTATTHLIDLANLIHDLKVLEQQYRTLTMEKQHILKQRLDKTTTALSSATIVE